jgi:hypothetical protein
MQLTRSEYAAVITGLRMWQVHLKQNPDAQEQLAKEGGPVLMHDTEEIDGLCKRMEAEQIEALDNGISGSGYRLFYYVPYENSTEISFDTLEQAQAWIASNKRMYENTYDYLTLIPVTAEISVYELMKDYVSGRSKSSVSATAITKES